MACYYVLVKKGFTFNDIEIIVNITHLHCINILIKGTQVTQFKQSIPHARVAKCASYIRFERTLGSEV